MQVSKPNKSNLSKSIKIKTNKYENLQKEIGWNDRFYLGNKISTNQSTPNFEYCFVCKNKQQHDSREKKISKELRNSDFKLNKNHKRFNHVYNVDYLLKEDIKNLEKNKTINNNGKFSEEIEKIKNLWENLGVTDNYCLIFESIIKELNDEIKKEFLNYEIVGLKKFNDLLLKLAKEIQNREKIINNLYSINQAINRDEYNMKYDKDINVYSKTTSNSRAKIITNANNNKEKTIEDIILFVKNLRILSLNIVNHLTKIRELISYNVQGGKYDLEKINKIFLFDKNYLIKMKYDLDFLKNSGLAYLYELKFEESDPFLIYFNFKSQENEKKNSFKISDEMYISIKKCQFLILQDLISYHIININQQKNKSISPRGHKRKGSLSNYNNNINNFNSKFKKAVKEAKRLYSPNKNYFNISINRSRPNSSSYIRKQNQDSIINFQKLQNYFNPNNNTSFNINKNYMNENRNKISFDNKFTFNIKGNKNGKYEGTLESQIEKDNNSYFNIYNNYFIKSQNENKTNTNNINEKKRNDISYKDNFNTFNNKENNSITQKVIFRNEEKKRKLNLDLQIENEMDNGNYDYTENLKENIREKSNKYIPNQLFENKNDRGNDTFSKNSMEKEYLYGNSLTTEIRNNENNKSKRNIIERDKIENQNNFENVTEDIILEKNFEKNDNNKNERNSNFNKDLNINENNEKEFEKSNNKSNSNSNKNKSYYENSYLSDDKKNISNNDVKQSKLEESINILKDNSHQINKNSFNSIPNGNQSYISDRNVIDIDKDNNSIIINSKNLQNDNYSKSNTFQNLENRSEKYTEENDLIKTVLEGEEKNKKNDEENFEEIIYDDIVEEDFFDDNDNGVIELNRKKFIFPEAEIDYNIEENKLDKEENLEENNKKFMEKTLNENEDSKLIAFNKKFNDFEINDDKKIEKSLISVDSFQIDKIRDRQNNINLSEKYDDRNKKSALGEIEKSSSISNDYRGKNILTLSKKDSIEDLKNEKSWSSSNSSNKKQILNSSSRTCKFISNNKSIIKSSSISSFKKSNNGSERNSIVKENPQKNISFSVHSFQKNEISSRIQMNKNLLNFTESLTNIDIANDNYNNDINKTYKIESSKNNSIREFSSNNKKMFDEKSNISEFNNNEDNKIERSPCFSNQNEKKNFLKNSYNNLSESGNFYKENILNGMNNSKNNLIDDSHYIKNNISIGVNIKEKINSSKLDEYSKDNKEKSKGNPIYDNFEEFNLSKGSSNKRKLILPSLNNSLNSLKNSKINIDKSKNNSNNLNHVIKMDNYSDNFEANNLSKISAPKISNSKNKSHISRVRSEINYSRDFINVENKNIKHNNDEKNSNLENYRDYYSMENFDKGSETKNESLHDWNIEESNIYDEVKNRLNSPEYANENLKNYEYNEKINAIKNENINENIIDNGKKEEINGQVYGNGKDDSNISIEEIYDF